MTTIYRIAKWFETFETYESRRHNSLSWVSLPTTLNSHGYVCLLEEFGDRAAEIYGAWCALVSVAATRPKVQRGTLVSGKGRAMTIAHIARLTGLPQKTFGDLFAWAVTDEIGWLEVINASDVAKVEPKPEVKPPPRTKSGRYTVDPDKSLGGDRQKSGLPDLTLPDLTVQNLNNTQLNTTTTSNPAGSISASGQGPDQTEPTAVLSSSLSLVLMDFEKVHRSAKRLLKLVPQLNGVMSRDEVWQLCYVGARCTEGFVSELCDNLRNPEMKSHLQYARTAIRNACKERGAEWHMERKSVPPAPPRETT